MKISDVWIDQMQEEYCYYLETLDPDVCPMSFETFEWLKIREAQLEISEIHELSYF